MMMKVMSQLPTLSPEVNLRDLVLHILNATEAVSNATA